MRPGGGTRRMMEAAVMLLPHPDSPTSARVSPGSRVRSTWSTARSTPVGSWNRVDSPLISNSGGTGAPEAARGKARWGNSMAGAVCRPRTETGVDLASYIINLPKGQFFRSVRLDAEKGEPGVRPPFFGPENNQSPVRPGPPGALPSG